MDPGLLAMWVSFAAIIMLCVAAALIVFSRQKLHGLLRVFTAAIAYFLMIVAGLIVILIIFSGAGGQ